MGTPNPDPNGTAPGARIMAVSLEISHLSAIATHPATRAELDHLQQLVDVAVARLSDATAADTIERVLEVARRRLQAVHDALADRGPDASV